MPITADDISIVLSGGSGNLDANLSIGGDPSSAPIVNNQINNLFNDVIPAEAEAGHEDYRCFYVFNDGDEPAYNIEVWIESQVDEGSSVEIGIVDRDELQRLTLSGGLPTAGTATFSYEGKTFSIGAIDDLAEAALEIQDGLNSLVNDEGYQLLETVEVTTPSSLGSSVIIFDVLFTDNDGKKDHAQIVLENDSHVPTDVTWTITTTQEGAPVNRIAPSIANDATSPEDVNFYAASELSPIQIYRLLPGEGFPMWARRTTPSGAVSVPSDGFTVKFRMETIEP